MRRTSDPLEPALSELGSPRPLPPEARARLERSLADAAAPPGPSEPADDEPLLRGADAPRPLPRAARERVGAALAREWSDVFAGVAAPRPLPAAARARVEAALLASRRRRFALPHRALAAAAATLVLVASTVAVTRLGDDRPGRRVLAEASPTVDRPPGAGFLGPPVLGSPPPPSAGEGAAGRAAGVGGAAPIAPIEDIGPPPPYYSGPFAISPPGFAAVGPPGSAPAPPPSPKPKPDLRVGIVRGDAAVEAAFRAYIRLLNAEGGAARHEIVLVETSQASPASNTIATVNLSGASLATSGGAPTWVRTPLLEGPLATEPILRDGVFGFSSPIERQAHLLADELFPGDGTLGKTAVIYRPASGPYSATVTPAVEDVLQDRGVTVIRRTYEPGGDNVFVPADAAVLALDTAHARAWLEEAPADYAPAKGISGIGSLLAEGLLPEMREGMRVLSPYSRGASAERRDLVKRSGRPASLRTIHGWVTAKMLAVAIWRADADTSPELAASLRAMKGYDNGFAPPYKTRSGTNSRTPEAMLFRIEEGEYVARSDFRTDPH